MLRPLDLPGPSLAPCCAYTEKRCSDTGKGQEVESNRSWKRSFSCECPTPENVTAVGKAHGDAEIPTRAGRDPRAQLPYPATATPAAGAWRGLAQRSSVPCPPHPRPAVPTLYFLYPLPCSPPAFLTPYSSPHPPPPSRLGYTNWLLRRPSPSVHLRSFPRGLWQPSNPEPEAEGGQDPALNLRCQAICFTHQGPRLGTVPGEFTLFSNFCSFNNFLFRGEL